MLKHLLILSLLYSCTTISNRPGAIDDEVSVGAALDQAQMSYLRGCVDANKVQITPSFERCRDMALSHRKELNEIMGVEGSSSLPDQPTK